MTRYAAALAALLFVAGASAATPAAASTPAGVWRNPKNSVHLRIQPCGQNVCGTVIWANARAKTKARRAGSANLIGMQLFREFRAAGAGSWRGRVFVPDLARTFSGTLRIAGPNRLLVRGCLVGRFLCRSQTWTRIS